MAELDVWNLMPKMETKEKLMDYGEDRTSALDVDVSLYPP